MINKSKNYKAVLPLLLLGVLFFSNAASANTWTTAAKITQIYSAASDRVYVKVEGTMINPASCSSSLYYSLAADNTGKDQIFSQMISSATTGHEVEFSLSNSNCDGSYPEIRHIRVDY